MSQKNKLKRLADRFNPVAVVDIGSNSVRMVVYDGLRRAPYPVFNEKILCGLGRGLALSGELAQDGVERAFAALRRFRAIADQIGVMQVFSVATAAAREATNGPQFISQAREILGENIAVLSGKQEARYAAMGVIAGTPDADGIVGDLGGGSLELIDVKDGQAGTGVTLPLGPLKVIDLAKGSPEKAVEIIKDMLVDNDVVKRMQGRNFYAVGGAWRNLGRLHMEQTKYPLRILHNYTLPCSAVITLADQVAGLTPDELRNIKEVSSKRADSLPLAAMALRDVLHSGAPQNVVMSVFGVREGVLFSKLSKHKREADPLLHACWDFARRYARSPKHELEIMEWTDQLFNDPRLSETSDQARMRHAACMLGDIGWRSHPDYRGDRARNMISQAAIVGLNHPERIFLALTIFYRYDGIDSNNAPKSLLNLLDDKMHERACQLSAIFRLAFVLSAAISGILPKIALRFGEDKTLELVIPKKLQDIQGEVVTKRLNQMAQRFGCQGVIVIV